MNKIEQQIVKLTKAGKTDKIAINNFAYDKGLSKKEMDEMYQMLLDAQRIPAEGTITETTTVTA